MRDQFDLQQAQTSSFLVSPLLTSIISKLRQEQVATGVTRRPKRGSHHDLGGQARADANGGDALASSIINEASESLTGSGALASLAPWPRSGGFARACPRTVGQPL